VEGETLGDVEGLSDWEVLGETEGLMLAEGEVLGDVLGEGLSLIPEAAGASSAAHDSST